MKNSLRFLALVVLVVCLVGLTGDRLLPASPVFAAGNVAAASPCDTPAEAEPVLATRSASPVVYIVTGLVGALFAVVAFAPLLVGERG